MRSWINFIRKFFIALGMLGFLGSLSLMYLSFYERIYLGFVWQEWMITSLFFIVLTLSLFNKKKKKESSQESKNLEPNKEYFQKEVIKVLRGFLKMSLVFWLHTLKKEKALSHQKAQDEIFHNLKKEFHGISWMQDLLIKLEQQGTKKKTK